MRRYVMFIILVLVGLVGILAPIFVDARHWWPRNSEKKKKL